MMLYPSQPGLWPVKGFLFCLTKPNVFGIPLLPVGLQSAPGLRVVAAAVWRSFSLAVLQKHICSSRQEEPDETKNTFYRLSTTTRIFLAPLLSSRWGWQLTWCNPGDSPEQQCVEESLRGCWQLADCSERSTAAPLSPHCQRMQPSEGKCFLPKWR